MGWLGWTAVGQCGQLQSWEQVIHNREQHWSQSQGTEDWCQREKDTDDESQDELNLNMNIF